MDVTPDFDIVIVGGGMAGAALACAVGRGDWRVALVDPVPPAPWQDEAPASQGPEDYDRRVVALTRASEEFLRSLGTWEQMAAQRISPYQGMYVWDADGTAHIEFQAADLYEPSLGHIVENRIVTGALWHQVRQLPVQIVSQKVAGFARMGELVRLTLGDGSSLTSKLVVAADGAESPLRRMAAFPTREWDYEQHGIVATVVTEKPHQRTAWQRFLPEGPLAFLPLHGPDDRYCSIVWSTTPEQARELLAMPDEAFCAALGDAFEQRLGAVVGVSRRQALPLRQRHAKHYVQPGIALVADAAHTIHPLAGQGINLGFLDVAVLADELLRARERGVDFAHLSVLQRFQRRRMGHNLATMAAMEGFKRLFGADPLPLRWMRNTGMRWLNEQAWLKNQVAALALAQDMLPKRWLSGVPQERVVTTGLAH